MAAERILTKHPQGKSGVHISKAKYDTIRAAIVDALRANGDLTFSEITGAIERKLAGRFDGSISWVRGVRQARSGGARRHRAGGGHAAAEAAAAEGLSAVLSVTLSPSLRSGQAPRRVWPRP